MNIAIIGSGGDGAGMNMCLYEIFRKLKNHVVILFNRGYQGIIDNDISDYTVCDLQRVKTKGGIIIKSSRSTEFMTEKGFYKAVNNLKNHKVDVLIIMGGNGSLKGARELTKAGINCIFIPTTIDNDIKESDYSIGFDTAVSNAVDFIEKVDTSMKAFDRACIYEVMGRHCPDIANSVSEIVKADYCFTNSSNFDDCYKKVNKAYKSNKSPIIILQENVINIDEVKYYLMENIKDIDVKTAVVGYVQRGGDATKKELFMAKCFAEKVVELVKNKKYNQIVKYNKKKDIFECKKI